jgi:hypothetical protein
MAQSRGRGGMFAEITRAMLTRVMGAIFIGGADGAHEAASTAHPSSIDDRKIPTSNEYRRLAIPASTAACSRHRFDIPN